MKRLFHTILIITLLFHLIPAASAHDVPEIDRLGSIELVLSFDGKPVSGGTLTAVRIAEVKETDGDFYFQSLLTGKPMSEKEVQSPDSASEIAGQMDVDKLKSWKKTIPDTGIVKFEDLDTGLYLIIQYDPAPGYNALVPFLVSVPYMQDGEYQYDITAKIKTELEKYPKPEPSTPETKPPTSDKLPQTGQLTWPIPVMTTCGLALFLLGWVLCVRDRRKDGYEE